MLYILMLIIEIRKLKIHTIKHSVWKIYTFKDRVDEVRNRISDTESVPECGLILSTMFISHQDY